MIEDATPGQRAILITGANGGIGMACARLFLESWSDARVFLGCRQARAQAEQLVAEFPERASILDLDVTKPDDWENAANAIVAEVGRIDVLVNNAGHHNDSLLATMAIEDWHAVIASNLTGTFLGCRAVIRPMMARRFGRIINIASLSALLAPAGQTNYAAAKAGVIALTQALAKEVARAGITVNALCPGYVATDTLDPDPTARAELAKRVPARRLGTPREIAAAVLHFAEPTSSYTTGAVLKIDGGIF